MTKDTTQPMEELDYILDILITETMTSGRAGTWKKQAKAEIAELIAIQETKARINELEKLWSDDRIYWVESGSSQDWDKSIEVHERIAQLNPNTDRKKVDV